MLPRLETEAYRSGQRQKPAVEMVREGRIDERNRGFTSFQPGLLISFFTK
jgi:hypothetical protein